MIAVSPPTNVSLDTNRSRSNCCDPCFRTSHYWQVGGSFIVGFSADGKVMIPFLRKSYLFSCSKRNAFWFEYGPVVSDVLIYIRESAKEFILTG